MIPEPPRIPDLDPRADAHLWGRITLPVGAALVAGWLALGVLALLAARVVGLAAAGIPAALGGGLATAWVAADGPGRAWRRREWRRRWRRAPREEGPLDWGRHAPDPRHRRDPVWVADGCAWAAAFLSLPPTAWLADEDRAAWHRKLAAALRTAAAHGLVVDVIAAQMPGGRWAPARPVDHPLLAARWRWWVLEVGQASVQTGVWLRLGWPRPERDAAWLHCEAVFGQEEIPSLVKENSPGGWGIFVRR
ncbi:MAG: hypothetical protein K6U87_15325, partial [Firmicutes bacterium]|nr:hypothetical protein [Bacillota bacterium]